MRYLTLAVASSLALSGCWLDDDDDNAVEIPPPFNTAPVAESESFITQTDTLITDNLSASDADGDELTFELGDEAANGTVEIAADGSFSYLPNAEFTGSDSFTFKVSDGDATAEGQIDITVEVLQVSFVDFFDRAFNQAPTDKPLSVNGREFTEDATDSSFDEYLMD
ncbi:Ig-like domain-containing protein [Alteromonas ponticola]|uniref:Cadherin-like domain-containing protein n=1 Tax=Alteromonas ponticola TaxID=2720613 RepID=A0ABX1R515_9ALTE|nr:Ig-like domain-containing protein [Alteromonas ponticola]NMH61535.1 cadherin-like domain-containing protein [Alteromonas ponticola]